MSGSALTCDEVKEKVLEYLDGVLPTDLSLRIEAHLAQCRPCRLVVEFARLVQTRLRTAMDRRSCPDEVRDRILNSFPYWSI